MRSRVPLAVASAAALLVAVLAFAWRTAPEGTPGISALAPEPPSAPAPEGRAELELEDEPTLDELFARRAATEAEELDGAEEPAAALAASGIAAGLPDAPRVRPRGTLRDDRMRQPLAAYRFELVDEAGTRAALETDAEGRFESKVALRVGPLRARYLERGRDWEALDAGALAQDPSAAEEGLSAPLALLVEAGPTYRVSILPREAPPPEALAARLRVRSPRGDVNASGRVHADTLPWVRFGPVGDGEPEGELVLASDDGLWVGSATVPVSAGLVPGVAEVLLERRATLVVRVADPEGAALPEAVATLAVEPPDGRRYERGARTDKNGRFEHRFLRVGVATLTVRAQRYADQELPVRLLPGETTELTVELAPLPSAGAVRGLVLSDSGTYRQDVEVRLIPTDQRGDGPPPLSVRVAWSERQGRVVGSFEFDRLPAGTWRLSIGERDWFDWEPRSTEVEAPLDGVVLRVHDAVEVADVVFDVRQPDGSPARRFDLEFQSGEQRTNQRGRDGKVVLAGVPVDRALHFRVDATNRVPVLGGAEHLASAHTPDGRAVRTATITLERGWGDRFRVVRADNRRPIPGAKLVVGERVLGTTDANGRVFVRADSRPGKLTVRWNDWTVVGGVDLTGRRRGGVPSEREIRMKPPPRKGKK